MFEKIPLSARTRKEGGMSLLSFNGLFFSNFKKNKQKKKKKCSYIVSSPNYFLGKISWIFSETKVGGRKILVEMPGIEPGAFHMQSERSTAELHPLLDDSPSPYVRTPGSSSGFFDRTLVAYGSRSNPPPLPNTCESKNTRLSCWPPKGQQVLHQRWVWGSHRRESMQVKDPPWLWNPGQTSPEVKKRGISDPTNRNCVFKKFSYERKCWYSTDVLTFLFDVNAVEGSGVVEGARSEGVVVGHGTGLLPPRRLVTEREAEFLRVWSILGYVLDVPYCLTEPAKRL